MVKQNRYLVSFSVME